MARILIGSLQTAGHVNPLLPLARELTMRGHDVGWYTGRKPRAKIEATGARHHAMREAKDYDEAELGQVFPQRAGLQGFEQLKFDMKHVFVDAGPPQLRDVQAIAKEFRPDLLVGEPGFVGGVFYHELTRTPIALLNVLPMGLPSRDAAPFGFALPPFSGALGRLRNRALNWAVPNVLFRDVQVHWNAVRASVGLPAAGWLLDIAPLVTRYLQPTVPALEYPRRDLPENVRFIGMLPAEASSDVAFPPWWADLEGLRPVVHVTQGTIANQAPDLFVPALRGLADEAVLVVIATGGADPQKLGLTELPSNARVASFLPYAQLLPKTTIMLTNGGYGGVQLALSHGVPLIVAGGSEDKPEVAARVAHSGAGLDLRTGKPSAEQVHRAVRTLLQNGRFRERARALKHEFGRYDSVQLGANAIEDLLPDKLREVTGVRHRASAI